MPARIGLRLAGLLVWAMVFSFFANLLILTGPLYMLQVYDRVLRSGSVETLIALSCLAAGLFLVMGLFDYSRGRVVARLGARLQTDLQERVFDAALADASGGRDGQESANALRSLEGLSAFFASPGPLVLMDLPWAPVFLWAIFVLHPALGWFATTGALVLFAIAWTNQVATARRFRQAAAAQQSSNNLTEEILRGNELVLGLGMQTEMRGRWVRSQEFALRSAMRANDWHGTLSSLTRSIRFLLQSAMLGLGAYLAIRGTLSGGAMIVGSILLGRALAPVEQLAAHWAVLQRAWAGKRVVESFLAASPVQKERLELPRPAAKVEVEGLTVVSPPAEAPLLRNVTFDLQPGAALGVIGANGSGKTTLARALVGGWPGRAGKIRLGGTPLDLYAPDRLGSYIGYLPQTVIFFRGSIAENIARMATHPDPQMVIKAATAAGVHGVITSLPDGYETKLGDIGGSLSAGHEQRIALARALYGDPALLVLDEPNSALDAEGSQALNRAIGAFKEEGGAVVVMTQRPAAIAMCEKLMVLKDGAVTAIGPRDEVLRRLYHNVTHLDDSRRWNGAEA